MKFLFILLAVTFSVNTFAASEVTKLLPCMNTSPQAYKSSDIAGSNDVDHKKVEPTKDGSGSSKVNGNV